MLIQYRHTARVFVPETAHTHTRHDPGRCHFSILQNAQTHRHSQMFTHSHESSSAHHSGPEFMAVRARGISVHMRARVCNHFSSRTTSVCVEERVPHAFAGAQKAERHTHVHREKACITLGTRTRISAQDRATYGRSKHASHAHE